MDLDFYRVFLSTVIEYTFFSAVHGIFYKIGHISANKSALSKSKNSEIISSILSDHSAMK